MQNVFGIQAATIGYEESRLFNGEAHLAVCMREPEVLRWSGTHAGIANLSLQNPVVIYVFLQLYSMA